MYIEKQMQNLVSSMQNIFSESLYDPVSSGPVITFEKTTYEVTEPGTEDDVAIVKVAVIRKGDLTQASSVRLFTKDGNADSGKDYNPISKGISPFY